MKDYSKMSDQDLNKSVADCNGVFWHIKPCNSESGGWEYSDNYEQCDTSKGMVAVELYDYCNNPSDAWRIMDEHKIGLAFVNGEWRASSVKAGYHDFSDKKAFRAAMIVYLMMKGVE